MRSRIRRDRLQAVKWAVYGLLLLLANTLQTMPGLELFGVKPLFILPLCLAVALLEGEFQGALFGAVGGLLWDLSAGRTVGLLAITLLMVCFFSSVLFQIYLRSTAANFGWLACIAGWLVLSMDHLFFYAMPGYSGARQRYLTVVLPMAVLSGLVCLLYRRILLWLRARLDPDEA